VPRTASLESRFREIDWSFPQSASDGVHDIHPYPAKFIPEIPTHALELVDVPGAVLDPFCGSGTTLVEAVRARRAAIGIDLNPIATLITRAKLSGWTKNDFEAWPTHRERLLSAALSGDSATLETARSAIPRLDHWFTNESQHVLAGATAYIRGVDDEPWRDRLAAALSSVVVRASRQESDTRYAAIEKNMTIETFVQWLARAVDRVASAASELASQAGAVDAAVITGDATLLTKEVEAGSVAAAIFSPPYPNAYEYWLYHKYRMYWLGFDPIAVRANEIGARPYYSGSGRLTEMDFAAQMRPVLAAIERALIPGGICFIIVGDSVIRGRHIDNGALVRELGVSAGFGFVAAASRTIRRTRRSFNLAVARASCEHVLLFQKT
jgi:DNA modification methylase